MRSFVRPDGRRFVRDPDRASLEALGGDVYCTVDESEIEPLLELGFEAHRREGAFLVPTGVRSDPLPEGIEIITLDRADEGSLRLLDDTLRQDVPGTDGWRWDEAAFHEETYESPGADPHAYLVAADAASGEYVGIVRVWMREPVPCLGFVGVRRDYRRRGLGRALVTAVLAEVRRRGIDEVSTEIDDMNVASRALFDGLGAHWTGTSVELCRRAAHAHSRAGA